MGDRSQWRHLLRLVTRAFYSRQCPPAWYLAEGGGEKQLPVTAKLAKVNTSCMAIVLMDHLLDHEWVEEGQVIAHIGQNDTLTRRALHFLKDEHFLISDNRVEKKRSRCDDGQDNEILPTKQRVQTYWAVHLALAFDVVQLRLHRMFRNIDDTLGNPMYRCCTEHCGKIYDALDLMVLRRDNQVDEKGCMSCSECGGHVDEAMSDDQRKALSQLRVDIESDLRPILTLVRGLKDTQPPPLDRLAVWVARFRQEKLAQAQAALDATAVSVAAVCQQPLAGNDKGVGSGFEWDEDEDEWEEV